MWHCCSFAIGVVWPCLQSSKPSRAECVNLIDRRKTLLYPEAGRHTICYMEENVHRCGEVKKQWILQIGLFFFLNEGL